MTNVDIDMKNKYLNIQPNKLQFISIFCSLSNAPYLIYIFIEMVVSIRNSWIIRQAFKDYLAYSTVLQLFSYQFHIWIISVVDRRIVMNYPM